MLLCYICISADIYCSGTKCLSGKGYVVNIQMFNLPKNNRVHPWNALFIPEHSTGKSTSELEEGKLNSNKS